MLTAYAWPPAPVPYFDRVVPLSSINWTIHFAEPLDAVHYEAMAADALDPGAAGHEEVRQVGDLRLAGSPLDHGPALREAGRHHHVGRAEDGRSERTG